MQNFNFVKFYITASILLRGAIYQHSQIKKRQLVQSMPQSSLVEFKLLSKTKPPGIPKHLLKLDDNPFFSTVKPLNPSGDVYIYIYIYIDRVRLKNQLAKYLK